MTIIALIDFLKQIHHSGVESVIEALLQQLAFAESVGLGYLTLNRQTSTLSGGESQRIKMIRQLGSSLNGLLYIFDEPSTGLHPADLDRINRLFVRLKDKGNTILIVEHDPDVISISDHIIEMGPQSGKKGGQMTFSGSYSCFCSSTSLTAQYLAQRKALKKAPRKANGWFQITNANLFNLCNVNVNVPKGVMTVVTGVAGSGKSTLFNRIFPVSYPECIVVDQKSITTNRRSNVATFIDAFDDIRGLFSKENNVDPSWFSLNSKGACPNCKGLGTVEYDLAFMENVTEVCEVCNGKRFIPKVLNYTCCQKNISDILQMSINEALDFFDRGSIREKIVPLQKVGLGYLNLGQPLTTLSGGELQRLKLAVQLKAPQPIYVLDEPTTGLHTKDIGVLLDVFHELIERGSTLIVIEHNLEMMCQADWIIDLGPGAGEYGGQVLFQGSPDKLLECNKSITAQYLRKYLVN